jgi:hypothetical protein
MFSKKSPKEKLPAEMYFSRTPAVEKGAIFWFSAMALGMGLKPVFWHTLTATMAAKYTKLHTKPEIAARIIMNALPKSSDGKENYATFTIVELDPDRHVRITNYDNPRVLIIRNGKVISAQRI